MKAWLQTQDRGGRVFARHCGVCNCTVNRQVRCEAPRSSLPVTISHHQASAFTLSFSRLARKRRQIQPCVNRCNQYSWMDRAARRMTATSIPTNKMPPSSILMWTAASSHAAGKDNPYLDTSTLLHSIALHLMATFRGFTKSVDRDRIWTDHALISTGA